MPSLQLAQSRQEAKGPNVWLLLPPVASQPGASKDLTVRQDRTIEGDLLSEEPKVRRYQAMLLIPERPDPVVFSVTLYGRAETDGASANKK